MIDQDAVVGLTMRKLRQIISGDADTDNANLNRSPETSHTPKPQNPLNVKNKFILFKLIVIKRKQIIEYQAATKPAGIFDV